MSAETKSSLADKYRAVFGTPHGHEVLMDIIKNCKMMKTSVVPNDPYMTYAHEGARSVALQILKRLGYDDAEFVKQYMKEQETRYDTLRKMAGSP